MKFFFVLMVVLLAGSNTYAHDGANGWVTVQDYRLWSNTNNSDVIRIQVDDGYYNPASSTCPDPDSYMVSTSLSVAAQQRIYSTLLAATMASKPVSLNLSTDSCEDQRPKIINVVVR